MNPTIRKILENINTLSKELEKADEKSNETNVSDATVHKEILRSFRGQNSQPTASTSNANTVSGGGTSSSTVPKFQLAYNFMKGRKRKQVKTSTKKASGTYVKDVILLAGPNEDKVPRQGVRIFLSENNHIVSGATFSKDLDYLPLCDYLKSLFPSKLGEFDDIEILMPVHSKLLPPNLAPGQQLSAFLLQKIFKDRPNYIRPSKTFLDIPGLQLSKKRKTETEVYELTDDDGEDEDDDLIFKTSVFEKQENEIKELSTVDPEKCDEPSGSKVTAEKADSNESSVVHEVTSLPTTSNSALSATKPGTPVPNTSSVVEAAIPTQSPTTVDSEFQSVITLCIQYIYEKGITDPVEVLRCAQSSFNVGRDLDIQRASESLEGETNFINIDRYNVLDSALEEVQELENPRLTLEVSFYGESAQDSGGPRREFFRLCLQEIKIKYFDNGLKEHLSKDYENVGLLMALSVLQNGSIPRFLSEELLQELFNASKPSKCIENLRKGFARVGLYQIGSVIPIFLQLFRPSPAAVLTRKKLLHVLSPKFSEEGSNARKDESSVYAAFNKYCREAASGQRGNVTLNHVLQFVTGADEEPLLGFGASPAIEFPEASGDKAWNFVPFANTCANTLHLRRPTLEYHLPSEEVLFEMFDYAFVNAYFGKV